MLALTETLRDLRMRQQQVQDRQLDHPFIIQSLRFQPDVRARGARCVLFDHQFAFVVITRFLQDADVLCGILPTNKRAIQVLTGYRLASSVLFMHYRSTMKHLPVELTRLRLTITSMLAPHCYLRCAVIEFTAQTQPLAVGMLPASLTELTIVGLFNQPLVRGMLPDGLQILRISGHFNQRILPHVLPDALQELVLNRDGQDYCNEYNQPFVAGSLPAGLTSLSLGAPFQQPLNGVLPADLISLVLPYDYSVSIARNVLPNALQMLDAGVGYVEPGALPSSLERIEFRFITGNDLYGVIPASVRELIFHEDTNLVPGWIPSGVQRIRLHRITLPLRVGIFPNSLQELALDSPRTDITISAGVLPASLTYLDLGTRFNRPLAPGVLPASLSVLRAPGYEQPLYPGCLPSQLSHLSLDKFNQLTDRSPIDVLPASLRFLRTKSERLLRMAPLGLQEIIFLGQLSTQLTPGVIPLSVTHLDLGLCDSDWLLPGSIPSSVTHLVIRCCISAPGIIPSSVTHLEVLATSKSHSTMSGYLTEAPSELVVRHTMSVPSSVTHLRFGAYMTSPLENNMVPSSVTHIAFGKHVDQTIAPISITSRLQCVVLPKEYPHLASLYRCLHIRPVIGGCPWADSERLMVSGFHETFAEYQSNNDASDQAQHESANWVRDLKGRWVQLEE